MMSNEPTISVTFEAKRNRWQLIRAALSGVDTITLKFYDANLAGTVVTERDNLARVLKITQESRDWYSEEVTRLSNKCHAICAAVRRLKGRGAVTCQSDPIHHF